MGWWHLAGGPKGQYVAARGGVAGRVERVVLVDGQRLSGSGTALNEGTGLSGKHLDTGLDAAAVEANGHVGRFAGDGCRHDGPDFPRLRRNERRGRLIERHGGASQLGGQVLVESYFARAGSKGPRHMPRMHTVSPGTAPWIYARGRSGLVKRASNVSRLAVVDESGVGQAWPPCRRAAARRVVSIPRCVEGRRNTCSPARRWRLRRPVQNMGSSEHCCGWRSGVARSGRQCTPSRTDRPPTAKGSSNSFGACGTGGRRHGIETHAGVRRGDPIGRHTGEAIGGGLGDVEIAGTVERRDRVDGAAGRDLAETIVSVVGDVDVACGIHGQSPRAPSVSRRWQAWGMRIPRRKRVYGE